MLGFVALWAIVTDAWNYSALLSNFIPMSLCKYLYAYFSRIVWMLTAFILIHRLDQNLFWNRKHLFSAPRAEPVFVVFMVLTTIYALAIMGINHGSWHITQENILLLSIKFLIVGIGEETVFRGWGYNLLKKVSSNAASLILSTCMFVALHWPAYWIKWLLYGQFSLPEMIAQSLSALFCGLLFAVMLQRSGTLWNPILAHAYYDWMLEVFA